MVVKLIYVEGKREKERPERKMGECNKNDITWAKDVSKEEGGERFLWKSSTRMIDIHSCKRGQSLM